jgi:hypothetical protein
MLCWAYCIVWGTEKEIWRVTRQMVKANSGLSRSRAFGRRAPLVGLSINPPAFVSKADAMAGSRNPFLCQFLTNPVIHFFDMTSSDFVTILQFGVYSAIACRDIQDVQRSYMPRCSCLADQIPRNASRRNGKPASCESYMYKCGCLADNCRNASRRNGKPASCEPCRINKTRCDHGMPKCDRCKQRGIEERCFYHPAPLTKPRTTTDGAGTGESRPLKRK